MNSTTSNGEAFDVLELQAVDGKPYIRSIPARMKASLEFAASIASCVTATVTVSAENGTLHYSVIGEEDNGRTLLLELAPGQDVGQIDLTRHDGRD